MVKRKVKRYDGAKESLVSEDKTEDSFSKETEPSSATPSIPEKSVSSEKTINYDNDKPKVVTKEELAKSGLTLREYMNKQQGLKPRGESAPAKAKINAAMAGRTVDNAYKSLEEPSKKTPGKGYTESRAKYESYRNAPSPLDNLKNMGSGSGLFKSIRERGESSTKMASGGMTSSASKRADGIATKGKTRGKIC